MDDIASEKPEKEEEQPLVTLALLAYNQEKYIREAVQSLLNQDYPRLEIILSDDCSTDSTFDIIESLAADYSGSHNILTNRNPVNFGLAQHFNSLVSRSHGEIVIVAAGDDISLPNRVSRTVEILCADPEATIVSFTDILIDESGKVLRTPPKVDKHATNKVTLNDYIKGRSSRVSAASRGYRKIIFQIFNDLNPSCPTEDTPCLLRGLIIGHALVSNQPGLLYRKHDSNLSSRKSLSQMKFDEIKTQYLRDADLALKENLISKQIFLQIKGWAESNYQKRLISAELYRSDNKISLFFRKIINNRHLKFLDKSRIFFNILLR